MDTAVRRAVAWGITSATIALVVLSAWGLPLRSVFDSTSGLAIALVPAVVVGAVITSRVPGNAVGPVLLGAGFLGALGGATDRWKGAIEVTYGLPIRDAVLDQSTVDALIAFQPGTDWIVAHLLGNLAGLTSGVLVLGMLPVVFPTGRARRRWAPWAIVALLALGLTVHTFGSPLTDRCSEGRLAEGVVVDTTLLIDPSDPCLVQVANPIAIGGIPGGNNAAGGAIVGIFGFMLPMLVGVASGVARFRAAGREERQQIRWLLATIGIFAALFIPAALLDQTDLLPDGAAGTFNSIVFVVALTLLAVSIGVAVLKYRLYDLGRVVSRTVTYTVLVGLVALGYGVGAVWLPTRLGLPDDPLWVAVTTLAIALAFNPVRRRLTRFLDRRFNRTPYDPEVVVDRLTETLGSATDPGIVVDSWAATVDDTLKPESMAIWVVG